MQRIEFGKTGLKVSRLGIGCPSATIEDGPEKTADIYHALLDAGVNVIDTAQIYGRHEEFLGRHLSSRRNEYVLISKCGHHDVLPDGSMRSRRISMDDIDMALRKLRTDVIDVMLLHSYDRDLLEKGEAVAVLAEARRAGKIRFAGYSGDNDSAQVAAGMANLSVIETSISLADQRNIDLLLPEAKKKGIGIIVKRPIANAAWKYLQADAPNERVQVYVDRLRAMNLQPADLGIDGEASDAWLELALRFVISIEGVHTPIASTTRRANALRNVDIINKGPLSPEQTSRIRAAFAEAQRQSAEIWKGEN